MTLEDARAREARAYAAHKAYAASVVAAVACPRCKAPAGTLCVWGSTNNGSPHQPRYTRAVKAGKVAS